MLLISGTRALLTGLVGLATLAQVPAPATTGSVEYTAPFANVTTLESKSDEPTRLTTSGGSIAASPDGGVTFGASATSTLPVSKWPAVFPSYGGIARFAFPSFTTSTGVARVSVRLRSSGVTAHAKTIGGHGLAAQYVTVIPNCEDVASECQSPSLYAQGADAMNLEDSRYDSGPSLETLSFLVGPPTCDEPLPVSIGVTLQLEVLAEADMVGDAAIHGAATVESVQISEFPNAC